MNGTGGAGPVVALAGLVAGIEIGIRAGAGPAGALLATGVAALAGAWLVAGPARLVIATLALVLLGTAATQRAVDGLEHHGLPDHGVVTVEGTLVSDARQGRFRADAFVRVHGADRIVLARASGADATRLAVLEAGDRVVLEGWFSPRPDDGYGSYLRWRHTAAVLDGAQVRAFRGPDGLLAAANRLRDVVVRGARPLPPEQRALLLGFLLGDTRAVPADVVDAYRAAGLSHLLAVSGANVAFVLTLAAPVLRRLALTGRSAGALAIVVLFAAMTRFEPSVLRASALATVSVLAIFLGRPVSSVRALALAVIALLLADPFLARSVAFQLSCGASAGIVLWARPLAHRLPGPSLVRDPLGVSLAAQAGVTPVLLATFGEIPLLSPLANLLAGPAAEVLGVYGLLASFAGGIVPALAPVLQPPNMLLVGWVTLVARVAAAAGGTVDARALLVLGGMAAVATLARRGSRRVPRAAHR